MGVRHTYQSGTANNGAKEISSTRWNEDHTISDFIYPSITATPALDQADWNPTNWNGTQPNRAVIIRATPASVSFIGGLVGGASGRVAIIKNDSTFCVGNTSRVIYAVFRLDSRQVAGGELTTNLPSTTTGLAPRANIMVGGTAAATTLQFNRLLARNVNY